MPGYLLEYWIYTKQDITPRGVIFRAIFTLNRGRKHSENGAFRNIASSSVYRRIARRSNSLRGRQKKLGHSVEGVCYPACDIWHAFCAAALSSAASVQKFLVFGSFTYITTYLCVSVWRSVFHSSSSSDHGSVFERLAKVQPRRFTGR